MRTKKLLKYAYHICRVIKTFELHDPVFNNKFLMTDPKGNIEFCFPETLNVSRGEVEGNIVSRETRQVFELEGITINVFALKTNCY